MLKCIVHFSSDDKRKGNSLFNSIRRVSTPRVQLVHQALMLTAGDACAPLFIQPLVSFAIPLQCLHFAPHSSTQILSPLSWPVD